MDPAPPPPPPPPTPPMVARPARWPTTVLGLGALAALVCGIAVRALVEAVDTAPLPLDEVVYDVTTAWTDALPWIRDAAFILGRLTSPVPDTIVMVTVIAFLGYRRRWRPVAFLAVSGIVGVVVTETMKVAIARPRPPGAEDYVEDLLKSFPSGHTTSGLYVFGALGVLLVLHGLAGSPRLRPAGLALFAFGIAIGMSRIVLGVHWATDVIAGWFLGSAVLLAAAAAPRPDDEVLGRPRPPAEG